MGQVETGNLKIAEIIKMIEEISQKTRVINDIVFQTKLLTFNASVEAAREGEHGKGFALIAEEIGNLAQMSGNAATEISALLETSVQKVDQIISESKSSVGQSVQEGKQKVMFGTDIARRCHGHPNCSLFLRADARSRGDQQGDESTGCSHSTKHFHCPPGSRHFHSA